MFEVPEKALIAQVISCEAAQQMCRECLRSLSALPAVVHGVFHDFCLFWPVSVPGNGRKRRMVVSDGGDRPCPGTQQEDPHEVGSDKGPQVVCLGFTPDASKFIAAAETTSLSTQM